MYLIGVMLIVKGFQSGNFSLFTYSSFSFFVWEITPTVTLSTTKLLDVSSFWQEDAFYKCVSVQDIKCPISF